MGCNGAGVEPLNLQLRVHADRGGRAVDDTLAAPADNRGSLSGGGNRLFQRTRANRRRRPWFRRRNP